MIPAIIPAGAAEPLSLDEVLSSAMASAPAVAFADAELASAEGVARARSVFLQNPELDAEWAIEGDGFTLELLQPLSLTGEGWFARAEARAAVRATEASRERALLVIAADARLAWADALLSLAQQSIATEAVDLANRVRAVVERRAEVGEASPLDVARARASEASALADALAARRRSTAAMVALAAFHPDAPVRSIAGDPLDALPTAPLADAQDRPDVAAAVARSDATRAALSRSRAGALPAVGVGGFYEDDGTATSFGPKIVVEIPLWDRNQAASGEARGQKLIADAELHAIQGASVAEVALTRANAEWAIAARRRLDGFDAAALEASGWVTDALDRGELDVPDAVRLQDELFGGRLSAIDATRDAIASDLEARLALGDRALLPGGSTP